MVRGKELKVTVCDGAIWVGIRDQGSSHHLHGEGSPPEEEGGWLLVGNQTPPMSAAEASEAPT